MLKNAHSRFLAFWRCTFPLFFHVAFFALILLTAWKTPCYLSSVDCRLYNGNQWNSSDALQIKTFKQLKLRWM